MKILFVSLGCDKNLVDSEEMLGALRERGYQFTDDEDEADAAIVNTCCFIMDAQKESIEQILTLAERRTEGTLKALIVTGCMAQRYKEEVLREIPEVDAVIGTTSEGRIAEILDEILQKGGPAGSGGYLLVDSEDKRTGTTAERVVTTGGRSPRGATSAAPTALFLRSGGAIEAFRWNSFLIRRGFWHPRESGN